MAKDARKPKALGPREKLWILTGCLALVLILAAAVLLPGWEQTEQSTGAEQNPALLESAPAESAPMESTPTEEQPEASEAPEPEQTEEPADPGLALPYTVEGLEISSLFSSDIMNPDAGLEPVEQLAGLELTNTSGRYLTSAQIRVTLTDGVEYLFQVRDLPDGESLMVFPADNAVYDGTIPCKSISAEAEFADGDQRMEESLSVSVDGAAVTLTNLTDQETGPLDVICHESLDGTSLFGGVAYTYRTESIPAGGSVTVDAVDCMIGNPVVVRVTPAA